MEVLIQMGDGAGNRKERGGEETKPTPKPQEAALTNGAVPQPTSTVLWYGPFFINAVIYQQSSERIIAGAFD